MRFVYIVMLFILSLQAYAEDTGLYMTRSMTVETAAKAAWQALLECRKRGYSVAVTVVDRGGNIQATFRDRFAGAHTPETAKAKAWTATSFRQSTGTLASLLQEGRIPNQVQHNPGALLVGGGEVIQAHGEIIGGIGVSGAPPGKSEKDSVDGTCALAGIKSIEEILEFSE